MMSDSTTTSQPILWISAGLKVSVNQSAEHAKKELNVLQRQTIKEEGCIFFDFLQHRDDPNSFTLWEEWINEAALTEHFNQVHTKDYLALSLTEVTYIEKLVKLT